jgi:putative ABC transport system permease protein
MTGGPVLTAPAAGLAALLHLDDGQRRALGAGAVVLPDPTSIPQTPRVGTFDPLRPTTVDVVEGQVRFWVVDGESDRDGKFTAKSSPTTVSLPALVVPWDQFSLGQNSQMGGHSAYVANETADRLGWAHQDAFLQFVDSNGPINRATQDRMTAAVQAVSDTGSIEIERGFERDDTVALLILMGIIGAIILVATFVSTALSMAEQLPLMGTLAAVGATRMTRRKLAAAQAFHLAGLGAVVGAAIGILPGIAAARTVTTTFGRTYGGFSDQLPEMVGPFVVVPWLQIAAPIVVIPLVAAVFAFVSIRRAPTVTRRTS